MCFKKKAILRDGLFLLDYRLFYFNVTMKGFLSENPLTLRIVFLSCAFMTFATFNASTQKVAGPLQIEFGVGEGYTLFAPLTSKTTYLIDNCGRVINTWQSDFFPANTVYLLPNGHLLRTTKMANSVITGGGGGGGVEILDWDSKRVWSFVLNNDSLRLHHDVAPLPNGNVLVLVWELRKEAEVLAQGGDPARIPSSGVIWSEQILELKPLTLTGTEVVWKWSLWDHLVQQHDNAKPNYGIVSEHPELVDLNYVSNVTADWIHANSIDYNAALDQIVLSSPFLNEMWIIDHSTTTTQAATHQGGRSGKGGDLLYRWGNPRAYGRGTDSDQKLFFQHDVSWVDDGPYKGGLTVFNNRKGNDFSSIEVIDPPLTLDGTYSIAEGQPFGPEIPELEFTEDPQQDLYSQNMSGVQALPNGHLLICSSRQGFIYEVDPVSKERFWFYRSPVTAQGVVGRDFMTTDPNYASDIIFRSTKYPLDYPAFSSRIISPAEPIEGEPWASCSLVTDVEESIATRPDSFAIYPNPFNDQVVIGIGTEDLLRVTIFSLDGKRVVSDEHTGRLVLNTSGLPEGLYIIEVNGQKSKILKKGNF